ncbi:hypothetical protein GMRT_11967 [Giardia muris]|uniref:Uncharacterized protein n=1 Tax=Giardia muris TaxID=5742 RepID=A0A4Z1STL5_GIAMU|nr:hypothetical protein GMRT_11967 [Giardia muris]|eukprot:TNJ29224.1 hypothetical protein GMRT_11967 [Giardia muris]
MHPALLASLIHEALRPETPNDRREAISLSLGQTLAFEHGFFEALGEVIANPDLALDVRIAALSQVRTSLAGGHIPNSATDSIIHSLLTVIGETLDPPLLSASIHSLSSVLAHSPTELFQRLIVVLRTFKCTCSAVMAALDLTSMASAMQPTLIPLDELDTRFLQLMNDTFEQVNLSILCTGRTVTQGYALFLQYLVQLIAAFHRNVHLGAAIRVVTAALPVTATPEYACLEKLVAQLDECLAWGDPSASGDAWRCLTRVVRLYGSLPDRVWKLCALAGHIISTMCMNPESLTHRHLALSGEPLLQPIMLPFTAPKYGEQAYQSFVVGPVEFLHAVLESGPFQTDDDAAAYLFSLPEIQGAVRGMLYCGCSIDHDDLISWLEDPFTTALSDIVGGKDSPCLDLLVEMVFSYQNFIAKHFLEALRTTTHNYATSFAGADETALLAFLQLDSALATLGAVWPGLTIEPGSFVDDETVVTEHDIYCVFERLFVLCQSICVAFKKGDPPSLPRNLSLLCLRRVLLCLSFIQPSIPLCFVENTLNFLYAMLTTEVGLGLHVLAAGVITSLLTDVTALEDQTLCIVEGSFVPAVLQYALGALEVLLASDGGFVESHALLLGNLLLSTLTFVSREQDRLKIAVGPSSTPDMPPNVIQLASILPAVFRILTSVGTGNGAILRTLVQCVQRVIEIAVYAYIGEGYGPFAAPTLSTLQFLLSLLRGTCPEAVLDAIRAAIYLLRHCDVSPTSVAPIFTALLSYQDELMGEWVVPVEEKARVQTLLVDTLSSALSLFPLLGLHLGQLLTCLDKPGYQEITWKNVIVELVSVLIEALLHSPQGVGFFFEHEDLLGDVVEYIDSYVFAPHDMGLSLSVISPLAQPGAMLLLLAARCAVLSERCASLRGKEAWLYPLSALVSILSTRVLAWLSGSAHFAGFIMLYVTGICEILEPVLYRSRINAFCQALLQLRQYTGLGAEHIKVVFHQLGNMVTQAVGSFLAGNRDEEDKLFRGYAEGLRIAFLAE